MIHQPLGGFGICYNVGRVIRILTIDGDGEAI